MISYIVLRSEDPKVRQWKPLEISSKEMIGSQPINWFIESSSEAYIQGDKQEAQIVSNSSLIGPPNPS